MQDIYKKSFRRKSGFGILEVMVAALVLGILYAAVSNLQKGNRDALFRIRGRDGATEVAQNIIDTLGAIGLAHFSDAELKPGEGGAFYLKQNPDIGGTWKGGSDGKPDTLLRPREWEGQPGLVTNKMKVDYKVTVKFSGDDDYKAQTGSMLLGEDCAASSSSCATHVYAKRVDVSVSWLFNSSLQTINVSGVIR